MPASGQIIRVEAPFTGGFVDHPTNPRQASDIQDGLFPLGVLCARGGWTTRGEANSLGAGVRVYSAAENLLVGQTAADIIVSGATGKIGLATSASRTGLAAVGAPHVGPTPPHYRIGPVFNGEQLLLPADRVSPILRYAGTRVALRTFTNGIWDAAASPRARFTVTPSSGNITTADIGTYITSATEVGSRRIVGILSTTKGHLSSDFQNQAAGGHVGQGALSNVGRLGLLTLVTDRGEVSTWNSAANAITGADTLWDTSTVPGSGRPGYFGGGDVAYGDFIFPIDAGDYLRFVAISAVTSDTAISTIAQATNPPDTTNIAYRIGRPLVGDCATIHDGRLYVAGVDWAPRRLQISPALWDGESPDNGEFSISTDSGRAAFIGDVEVDCRGRINGLLSLPNGNLGVLTEQEAFIAWGQYPSINFERVGEMGNFGGYSSSAVDDRAFFAGRDGVFEFRGNTPRRISEPIKSYWNGLMSAGVESCTIQAHEDHLVVTVDCVGITRHLVYDLRRDVWCGTWSLPSTVTHLFASRVAGQPDRMLMSYDDDVPGELSTCFIDHETDNTLPSTNPPTLSATTGETVFGDVSQEKEVKWLKVAYKLRVTSGTPTFEVTAGDDPSASDPMEPALTATTGETIGSVIAEPATLPAANGNGLGERVRRFSVKFDFTPGAASTQRVVIHEIQALVKGYRFRG